MCVDDVTANCHMGSNRNAGSPACRGDAEVLVGEAFLLDDAADGFADAVTAFCCLANDLVQSSRFEPESRLPEPDPAGNRFACSSGKRKLEVMDDPRAVHGNVGHDSAFDEINDVSRQPQLDDMSAHHQYDGTILFASIRDARYEVRKLRLLERSGGRRKRKAMGPM